MMFLHRDFRTYDGFHMPRGPYKLNKASPHAHGLQIALPLQDNQLDVIRDIGPHKLHSTITGTLATSVLNPTFNGRAINFQGSSGNYIDTPTVPNMDSTNDTITVACWAKSTEAVGGINAVWRADDGITDLGMYDWADLWQFWNGAARNTGIASVKDRWYHVVVTQGAAATTADVYLDGLPISTGHGKVAIADSIFRIASQPSGVNVFNGPIFDFRVYNREMSTGEIWSLYNPSTRWDLFAQTNPHHVYLPPPVTGLSHAHRHLAHRQPLIRF